MSEEDHSVSKGVPRAKKGWRDPLIERAAKLLKEGAPSGTSSDDSRQQSSEAMARPTREEGADNQLETESSTPEHIDHEAMAGEARSSGKRSMLIREGVTGEKRRKNAQALTSA